MIDTQKEAKNWSSALSRLQWSIQNVVDDCATRRSVNNEVWCVDYSHLHACLEVASDRRATGVEQALSRYAKTAVMAFYGTAHTKRLLLPSAYRELYAKISAVSHHGRSRALNQAQRISIKMKAVLADMVGVFKEARAGSEYINPESVLNVASVVHARVMEIMSSLDEEECALLMAVRFIALEKAGLFWSANDLMSHLGVPTRRIVVPGTDEVLRSTFQFLQVTRQGKANANLADAELLAGVAALNRDNVAGRLDYYIMSDAPSMRIIAEQFGKRSNVCVRDSYYWAGRAGLLEWDDGFPVARDPRKLDQLVYDVKEAVDWSRELVRAVLAGGSGARMETAKEGLQEVERRAESVVETLSGKADDASHLASALDVWRAWWPETLSESTVARLNRLVLEAQTVNVDEVLTTIKKLKSGIQDTAARLGAIDVEQVVSKIRDRIEGREALTLRSGDMPLEAGSEEFAVLICAEPGDLAAWIASIGERDVLTDDERRLLVVALVLAGRLSEAERFHLSGNDGSGLAVIAHVLLKIAGGRVEELFSAGDRSADLARWGLCSRLQEVAGELGDWLRRGRVGSVLTESVVWPSLLNEVDGVAQCANAVGVVFLPAAWGDVGQRKSAACLLSSIDSNAPAAGIARFGLDVLARVAGGAQ